MRRVVVAAPSYLKRAGHPLSPADLAAHRIVGGPVTAHASAWQFERDGKTISVDLLPNVSTNDTSGAVAAAVGGLGITSTTSWACRQELKQRTLLEVMSDWGMGRLQVHAYFPMGRTTRSAAQAFVDFLVEELQADLPRIGRAAIGSEG